MILITAPAQVTIVRQAQVQLPAVPVSDDPQVAALQERAERHVDELWRHDDVVAFELERVAVRSEMGLGPVPVTNRGARVLTLRNYAVDQEGYLTLG